ncbi:MAG: hypothetical protein AAF460_01270 [Pseudomonadota bacterium]
MPAFFSQRRALFGLAMAVSIAVCGLTGCLATAGSPSLDALDPVSVYDVAQGDLSLTWVEGEDSLEDDSALWESVLALLPVSELRGRVVEFQVFSDGPEDTLAYIAKLDPEEDTWLFALDYVDAAEADEGEWVTTLTHEYAHIITLGAGQLDGAPITCARSFEVEEGCALPGSVLLAWVSRFWPPDLQRLHTTLVGPPGEDPEALTAFFERYPLDFVNEYAASNPVEDVAESFAYFVFLDTPDTPRTERERKVQFFYDYPNLVRLRSLIRSRTPVRRASIDSEPG